MNTKTKHFTWSGLAYALVLILLATTMVGIVAYAAGSKTHNIGGNVTFSADGVEATVAATSWEGCTIGGESYSAGQTVLSEITYSTDISTKSDMESAVETWEDMQIVITNTDGTTTSDGTELSAGVATLSFTITNNSSDYKLKVSAGTISGTLATEDNSLTITTSLEDEVAVIDVYGSGSNTLDITVTFTVQNASYDSTLNDFSVPFTIEKYEPYEVTISLTNSAGYDFTTWDVPAAYCVDDVEWIALTSMGTITANVYSSISFRGFTVTGEGANCQYLNIKYSSNSSSTYNGSSWNFYSQEVQITITENTSISISTTGTTNIE